MVKAKVSNRPIIFRASDTLKQPKFPFNEDNLDDVVDDDDDCIICNKLLLNHTEEEANECYSTLTKRKLFRKELSRKQSEVP